MTAGKTWWWSTATSFGIRRERASTGQRAFCCTKCRAEIGGVSSTTAAQGGEFFSRLAVGRGLAVGDLDNDGWPDVVVSHSDTAAILLRNEAGRSSAGSAMHWLGVRLVGRQHAT